MSRIARNVLSFVGVILLAFTAGNVSGLYFYPQLFGEAADAHDDHGDHHLDHQEAGQHQDHHDEENHVALTKQAFENLQLQLGTVTRDEYWKSHLVPGDVIGIPGKSAVSVSAPVTGVVEQVFARAGQAVGPSDHLFTIRITDDNLTDVQSKLLATLSRRDILRNEIARLKPLTESGTLSGRRQRDLA